MTTTTNQYHLRALATLSALTAPTMDVAVNASAGKAANLDADKVHGKGGADDARVTITFGKTKK